MNRKAELIFNKAFKARKKGRKRLSQFYIYILRIVFSMDVTNTANIHPSTQFVHNGLGCVFHPNVNISPNCRIYQNVTLGGNAKVVQGKVINRGGPTLEEGVTIFSGACILGPVTIGKNSIVGANAVVTKNVPPNCLAVGVPAEIKKIQSSYYFGEEKR